MTKPAELKRGRHYAAGASLEAVELFADPLADRFSTEDLARKPAPPRMVAAPYVPRRTVSVLVGPGGVGKGQTIIALAVAKALGLDFFGHVLEPERVLLWTAEDDRDAILRAIYPLASRLDDRARRALADGLIVKSTVGADVKLTRKLDGAAMVAGDVDALIEYASSIPGLGLVIADTLSRLNGVDESNEGLALAVTAAERIAVALDCGVLLTHHTGKAQMRAGVNDQYSGRGGSAVSDNARSVLALSRVTADDQDAPTNGGELIREGRLLRLSHVKSNYVAAAPDLFLERVLGPSGPWLRPFRPEWDIAAATASTWAKLADWMRSCGLSHPTATSIDDLPAREFGTRSSRRAAVAWALDNGRLIEEPHPTPRGRRTTFLRLAEGDA